MGHLLFKYKLVGFILLKDYSLYIAAPLHGIERDQLYKERLRQVLIKFDCDVIDPWQREKVDYFTGEEW